MPIPPGKKWQPYLLLYTRPTTTNPIYSTTDTLKNSTRTFKRPLNIWKFSKLGIRVLDFIDTSVNTFASQTIDHSSFAIFAKRRSLYTATVWRRCAWKKLIDRLSINELCCSDMNLLMTMQTWPLIKGDARKNWQVSRLRIALKMYRCPGLCTPTSVYFYHW